MELGLPTTYRTSRQVRLARKVSPLTMRFIPGANGRVSRLTDYEQCKPNGCVQQRCLHLLIDKEVHASPNLVWATHSRGEEHQCRDYIAYKGPDSHVGQQ